MARLNTTEVYLAVRSRDRSIIKLRAVVESNFIRYALLLLAGFLRDECSLSEVIFCCFSAEDLLIYEMALGA